MDKNKNQSQTKSLVAVQAKLLKISEKSVYRWKTQDHVSLMTLLDKYFSKEDLEEFLDKGSVEILDEFSAFRVACKNDPAFKQFLEFKEFQIHKEKIEKAN